LFLCFAAVQCIKLSVSGISAVNNTGYTQKNGAVSKVNKKFISHFQRAQHTLSDAATVQVSHALPAVRFSCLLRGRGTSFQDGVAVSMESELLVVHAKFGQLPLLTVYVLPV
jgi:hypothetical protein